MRCIPKFRTALPKTVVALWVSSSSSEIIKHNNKRCHQGLPCWKTLRLNQHILTSAWRRCDPCSAQKIPSNGHLSVLDPHFLVPFPADRRDAKTTPFRMARRAPERPTRSTRPTTARGSPRAADGPDTGVLASRSLPAKRNRMNPNKYVARAMVWPLTLRGPCGPSGGGVTCQFAVLRSPPFFGTTGYSDDLAKNVAGRSSLWTRVP